MIEANSPRCGLIVSVNSVRMRIISRAISASVSRMRLLASTMASGSIKTVLPVALSSWTIPCSRRLFMALTGSTSLPSRSEGCTSLSKIPSCLPWLIMRRSVPLMLLVTRVIVVRNCWSWGEAVSLMLPALSNTWPMAVLNSGSACRLLVSCLSRGYDRCPSPPSVAKKRTTWPTVSSIRCRSNKRSAARKVPGVATCLSTTRRSK